MVEDNLSRPLGVVNHLVEDPTLAAASPAWCFAAGRRTRGEVLATSARPRLVAPSAVETLERVRAVMRAHALALVVALTSGVLGAAAVAQTDPSEPPPVEPSTTAPPPPSSSSTTTTMPETTTSTSPTATT